MTEKESEDLEEFQTIKQKPYAGSPNKENPALRGKYANIRNKAKLKDIDAAKKIASKIKEPKMSIMAIQANYRLDAKMAGLVHRELKKMRSLGVNEGLADLADMAERDHEVQMARSDLYKIAKYAIKLHEMMKNVSEAEGIEGWQQAKITKAADYLGSVYHALDYDTKFESVQIPEDAKPKQHKRVLSDSEVKSYKGSLAMKMAEITESKGVCPDCGNPSYTTLPEEKQKGVDGKVCWKGYKRMGTKKKGGKTVDNCVKM